jgi:hypothetical protein
MSQGPDPLLLQRRRHVGKLTFVPANLVSQRQYYYAQRRAALHCTALHCTALHCTLDEILLLACMLLCSHGHLTFHIMR